MKKEFNGKQGIILHIIILTIRRIHTRFIQVVQLIHSPCLRHLALLLIVNKIQLMITYLNLTV